MPSFPKPPPKPKKPKKWISSKSHKPKKKSISRRKQLEVLLDRLTSQIVILRDGGCVTPGGCSGKLTCSHYYPRGKKKTRWSLVNTNCQCFGHNGRHNRWPSYYGEYMLKTYSKEQLIQIAEDANQKSWKWSIGELELMVEEYQKLYSDYLARTPTAMGRPELIIRK